MNLFRTSLMARIFIAIAAATGLVITVMAFLVAASMRDGFARYLLKGELSRFDDLEAALVLTHDTAAPGWPQLAQHPRAWDDFLRTNVEPPNAGRPPPSAPPPRRGDGVRPIEPSGGAGPPRPQAGRPPLGERLALLGPDGSVIVEASDRARLTERRAICTDLGCEDGLLGYLELSSPFSVNNARDQFFLREQYAALALSALIALLISAMAAYVVARRMLIPIRHLKEGTQRMAAGDYSARIPHVRADELGQLIGHFNALAATLELTEKAEREWISNTSHELQTPLAVLRAQIEALQDGVRAPDAVTLSGMHAATMRLSRLVQDIQTLSHGREGGLGLLRQDEDLCRIVRDAAEMALPGFIEKGIKLELDLPEELTLPCDRARVGQIIDNLLQNALRYTNPLGRVRLHVCDSGRFANLVFDDTPPVPPDTDMMRLFDRFYRAESSRSRVHGGSGLGLSVCRALVQAHGGTITAEPSDLGGLRVVVQLPKGSQ